MYGIDRNIESKIIRINKWAMLRILILPVLPCVAALSLKTLINTDEITNFILIGMIYVLIYASLWGLFVSNNSEKQVFSKLITPVISKISI